ncbi:MAG: sugar phosphate isomerase/epimerase family protein [Acidimicrobiales bacterium]|jgi:sugar phosphate isomerase/epimerase
MRLALSQFCLPELSTREFLDVVVRAGAEGCELAVIGGPRAPEDPRAMIAAARHSPIPIESVNVLRDWALPDDPDCRPVFDMLVEVAVETSCPFIVCVAPIRYENMPPHKDVLAAASDRLAMFAEMAESAGVRLALEQVGLSSTRLGAQSGISSLADALAVVEAAGPGVALALDSYNVATGGNRFEDIAQIPRERIAVAAAVDGLVTGSPRVLPGDGELPLASFAAALVEAGFDGALSVEIFPEKPSPDPLEFARRCLASVRALVQTSAV